MNGLKKVPARTGKNRATFATVAALAILATGNSAAKELTLPAGMGGVPDIGAIPCSVFTNMLVIGPLGTRHSLLTWTEGYLYAKTNRSMEEIVSGANAAGGTWNFGSITDHFVSYCEANPEASTGEAAQDLSAQLVGASK